MQPISFVTIFLKPESRDRCSYKDLPTSTKITEVSQTHAPDDKLVTLPDKDTAIVSSLQALFPKAFIKQEYEERNIPTTQSTLLEAKAKHNNGSTSTAVETCLTRYTPTNPVASTSSLISSKEKRSNGYTSTNSLVPTKSLKTVSTFATSENGNSKPIRRHWHVSTQTPDAWACIDSFLGKRRIEKSEIHIEAKRMRQTLPNVENGEYCRINANEFKAACANLLSPNSALLISACVDARERCKVMQRSFEGKQFALELFLMAPDAYRSYRPLCMLPTVRQLWRHVRNWDMPAGLNDNVLNVLHLKMKSLPAAERRCCLCVNEMQLRPHLFYNLSRDRIVGFHNIGTEKRRALARKVLVMMARSVSGNWEQPVAYYFHSGVCTADITMDLIFQTIIKLRSIGATVHALVTNTSPIFLRLSRRLNISVEHPSFLVENEKVFYIFDVARLMRATRNILMRHDLHFREKRASWTDIELFFRHDGQMRLPLVPKLSIAHLEPNRCQKTETKYAVQVLSSSVAAGLSAHIANGKFPLKAVATVEIIRNFDQLYDILNSFASTKSNTKDFTQAFTGNTHEMCFLQRMLDFLKSIRVVSKSGACVRSIGSFERWQITINATIQLWDVLKEHQLPYLRTKRLSQEGIERIFRSIKRQSGNRARPTPIQFTRAFKNLVSKHLLEHSSGDNSTMKTRKMLKRIAASSASAQSSSSSSVSSTWSFRTSQQETPPSAANVVLNVMTTNYRNIDSRLSEKITFKRVCEYLLDECSRAHNCNICVTYAREAMESPEGAMSHFSSYIFGLEEVFMRHFEELAAEENLGARMLRLAQQVIHKPPCPDFPVALLIKLYLRIRIYVTLLRHNKICKNAKLRDSLNLMRL